MLKNNNQVNILAVFSLIKDNNAKKVAKHNQFEYILQIFSSENSFIILIVVEKLYINLSML